MRAAATLVALYGLCVLVPSAALAFGDSSMTHCITGEPHARTSVHTHDDGTAHAHDGHAGHTHAYVADDSDQPSGPVDHHRDTAGNCCGLFCVTALAPQAAPSLSTALRFTIISSAMPAEFAGRTPDQLYRPPNPRLPL